MQEQASTAPPEGTAGATAEILVHLFPHAFLDGLPDEAASAPAGSVSVRQKKLAPYLLAVPLFTLIRDGFVTAELQKPSRGLGLHGPEVRVALGEAAGRPEGFALSLLERFPAAHTVKGLIQDWIVGERYDPWQVTVDRMIVLGRERGLLTDAAAPAGWSRMWRRTPSVAAVPAAAEPLRPAAEALGDQWRAFRRSMLGGQLEAEVKRGLSNEQITPDYAYGNH